MAATFTFSVAVTPDEQATADAMADAIRDVALDPDTGDVELDENGDLPVLRGLDAIASDLESAFKMWLGEWPYDTSLGFDWAGVLGQKQSISRDRQKWEEQGLAIPGINAMTDFSSDYDAETRQLSVDMSFSCDFGLIALSITGQE